MAEDFTKNLVDLSNGGFSPDKAPELGFYHRESGFNVRPLVVMSQECFPIEAVEVPHPIPQPVKCAVSLRAFAIFLEGDIRCSVHRFHSVEVFLAGISLVSRNFVDGECLGSCVDQLGKLWGIGAFSRGSLYAGDYVRFDTAHNMRLNPSLFRTILQIYFVKRGSYGKIQLEEYN